MPTPFFPLSKNKKKPHAIKSIDCVEVKSHPALLSSGSDPNGLGEGTKKKLVG